LKRIIVILSLQVSSSTMLAVWFVLQFCDQSTNVNEYDHIQVIAYYLAPSKWYSVSQMVQNCSILKFLLSFFFWLMKKWQNTGPYLYLRRIVLYQRIIIMICFGYISLPIDLFSSGLTPLRGVNFTNFLCVGYKWHSVLSTNIMQNSFRVSYA